MRGSCSSSLLSIPSRALPRSSPRLPVISSATRSSSLLASSSSSSSSPYSARSFSTSLPSSYRTANWLTRADLKEVPTQAPAPASEKPSFLSRAKGLFGRRQKITDSIEEIEKAEGTETDPAARAQRKAELLREEAKLKAEEDKLAGRQQGEKFKYSKLHSEREYVEAVKTRRKPIEYKFKTACFKISPRKLALIGRLISRRPIGEAILQLEFSIKRAARRLKNSLIQGRNSAIALGMDKDLLFLQAVWVGKGATIARVDIKGRGRTGIKHHRSARMYFNVIEGKTYQEREHAFHLERLKQVRIQGASPNGARFHSRKIGIEGIKMSHWRW